MSNRISVQSRSYFSVSYLCGAAAFARNALALEHGSLGEREILTHRAYVVSAITSSAAALESMINEAFADASETEGSCVSGLSHRSRESLAALWAVPRTSSYAILDKFDVAHLMVTGSRLDRSHHRFRNASWVVRLRNDFVHFEPTWRDHGSETEPDKIERALGGLFAANRLTGLANPYYPDKLLGHGCAAWCVGAALEFADHFWQSIGVRPPYEAYRRYLSTT